MPRGSDKAAHSEFARENEKFENAEQLIRYVDETRDPNVLAASLKKVNVAATAGLDLDQLSVPEGHRVIDATVRGEHIVFVAEHLESGRTWKGTLPFEGARDEGPRRSSIVRAREAVG